MSAEPEVKVASEPEAGAMPEKRAGAQAASGCSVSASAGCLGVAQRSSRSRVRGGRAGSLSESEPALVRGPDSGARGVGKTLTVRVGAGQRLRLLESPSFSG